MNLTRAQYREYLRRMRDLKSTPPDWRAHAG
jgi:hypothetical protein